MHSALLERSVLLIVALGLAMSACPSTAPTDTHIDRVDVIGDPTTPSFVLRLTGRGLGLTGLTYDLSTGTGSANADLHLAIFAATETNDLVTISREQITLLSPRRLDAEVLVALEAGEYGVRLYAGLGTEPVAEVMDAFEVRPSPTPGAPIELEPNDPVDDGGFDAGESPTAPPSDAGAIDGPALPDGGLVDAAGETDAALLDAEILDAGSPRDSGLGPFVGSFQFRREVLIGNASTAPAPAGTTLRIAIPHASLLSSGRARSDAADIAIYFGPTPLDRQWDDPAKIGTDELVMLVPIPIEIPVGAVSGATPLVLYFGDPNAEVAPTDSIYVFAEHFSNGLPSAWGIRDWYRCNFDRSVNGTAPTAGSYCVQDSGSNPTRITLSSPNLSSLTAALAPNQVYEISFWMSGLMVNPSNDLFYFAYGPNPSQFHNTTLLPPSSYPEFPPNRTVTFDEANNAGQRTVEGWRFPTTRQWWTRTRARFRPGFDAPSLHFRFISADGNDNGTTIVSVDDCAIRIALEPELESALGPLETR